MTEDGTPAPAATGPAHASGPRWPRRGGDAAALDRLADILDRWAAGRGEDWRVICNRGPAPAAGPLCPFRWRVIEDAVAFASGRADGPPADFSALPNALQQTLTWAIPASIHAPATAGPDAAAAAAAMDASDALARDIARLAQQTAGGSAAGSSEAAPPVAAEPWSLVRSIGASPQGPPNDRRGVHEGAGDLIAAALQAGRHAMRTMGMADAARTALLSALERGPVDRDAVAGLAHAHGVLPNTLVDAVDAWAVSAYGMPAVECVDDALRLSAPFLHIAGHRAGDEPA